MSTIDEIVNGLGTGLYVDGHWRPSASGATFEVENPATGRAIAEVADAGVDDAAEAIAAAGRAQAEWGRTAPRDRAEILRRAFELVQRRAEDFAQLMTAEMGKPLAESRGEVTYGAEFLRWFSEEAVRIGGDYGLTPDGGTRMLVRRTPVGPCILVTPWNFPLAMATRKIGPAIAAGCTMVVKPAGLTPLTTLALTDVLAEAGLPPGVLNVACTTDSAGVVETWTSSPIARKLSFTGSTGVGRTLLRQCADNVLRTSMELGGNAPFVVCADADLDTAVTAVMQAKMRNMGEACTAANRILVHRAVIDDFADRLTGEMSAMTVGDGAAEGTDVGPLIAADAVETVEALVAEAVERGATVRCGGRRVDGPGHFYSPTVLTDVPADAEIARTEIFGPVAALTAFDDDEQALRLANDTDYGLAAYVITESLDRALRYSDGLAAGMIGVNTGLVSNAGAPFGGVKQSGLGREGGRVGIDEYLETTFTATPVR